jgi:natural product biosynthesis luciferase-like monooxygenase protein
VINYLELAKYGSIFSHPAVLSAGLAMITEKIQLRAGSLVSPLHDVVRIAESWAIVDNLSHGRVAISFGSGWNVNDFIFFPDRYTDRKALMYEQIQVVQTLWQGAALTRKNSFGKDVAIQTFPRPVQSRLPIWVTSSGSPDTFAQAGRIGANVLTHMISQDKNALAQNIQRYRVARKEHHFDPASGIVSLMLHTFIGKDPEVVKAKARQPFRAYLRSAVLLENKAAQGGGAISGGHKVPHHTIPAAMMEELLDITFERYYSNAALLGTPDSCKPLVMQLRAIGVDEIACLIDFGIAEEDVLIGLDNLNDLRLMFV